VLARTTSTDYTVTSFLFHTPEISIARRRAFHTLNSKSKYHEASKDYDYDMDNDDVLEPA
ncbi:hypothetical protein ACPV5E_23485, partial [Vibrio mediterranei]|uniref:hypothetical protein n=1 Tax=Vibrio mediterranei TaxID=689 RepID=UPI004069272D